MALFAQGLLGSPPAWGSGRPHCADSAVCNSTRSRSWRGPHELVAYARHGPISRAAIEEAYWGPASATFEYWSHAACILPLEDWPLYAVTRRARQARGRRWHLLEDEAGSTADVVARLRAEGPLTARELGGAKKGGVWWDWSEIKIAAEWLLDTGVLVCRQRRGFQRVYDLAERAIPARAGAARAERRGVRRRFGGGGGSLARRGHCGRPGRLQGPADGAGAARAGRHRPRAGDGRRLGQTGLRGPWRHRRAQPEGQGPQPPDLPVRLAGLGQSAHPTTLRLPAPAGGLRAAATSVATGTSPCPCSAGPGSSAWSIPAVGVAR